HGAAFITFSSDLVFDGTRDVPYGESDTPQPLNVYGATKAEAERRVLEAHPDALVVRTSAFSGPWDRANFVTKALDRLRAGEPARSGRYHATVFDERPHVAGNCHTARDERSDVMIHTYGPHIFHTSREDVWRYVNQFASFGPYTNRVKAHTSRGVFSLPINLLTINQFFGKRMNPAEARA